MVIKLSLSLPSANEKSAVVLFLKRRCSEKKVLRKWWKILVIKY